MNLSKSKHALLAALGLVALAGCATPEGEPWPTVSFGGEIAANEAAKSAPYEITLAPLPALTGEEKAGAENPGSFQQQLEDGYAALARRMLERKSDYMAARQGLQGIQPGRQFHENWLTAQMELSNVSQTTERLTTLRARIMLLGDPLPEAARVLLKKAEALELENRVFVRDERAFLNLRNPESS